MYNTIIYNYLILNAIPGMKQIITAPIFLSQNQVTTTISMDAVGTTLSMNETTGIVL